MTKHLRSEFSVIASVDMIIDIVVISFEKVEREAYANGEREWILRGRTYGDRIVVAESREKSIDHSERSVLSGNVASNLRPKSAEFDAETGEQRT